MIVQRAALLAAGPLAALGFSAGLAHADPIDLFSGDGILITAPDGLIGPATSVGGLPPIDNELLYANQAVEVNDMLSSQDASVYTNADFFGGNETLVDLTPGQPIADSDIFSTFSMFGGTVALEHDYIAVPLDGLDVGSYDALVVDGTTFALPESVSNLLGPDFGLTALDVAVLTAQADGIAATLDLTPFLDLLSSL